MTFFRSTILCVALLSLLACGEDAGSEPRESDDEAAEADDDTSEPGDENEDDDEPSGGGQLDGGRPPKDAGGNTPRRDSGTSTDKPGDGGAGSREDAGKVTGGVDAGRDAGGGITIPDIMFPDLFPTPDAGSEPPKSDGGMGAPGAKDGPCKDLMLLCFDPIDMFIFNPELCFTCNGGKGCQGCAIPFAY